MQILTRISSMGWRTIKSLPTTKFSVAFTICPAGDHTNFRSIGYALRMRRLVVGLEGSAAAIVALVAVLFGGNAISVLVHFFMPSARQDPLDIRQVCIAVGISLGLALASGRVAYQGFCRAREIATGQRQADFSESPARYLILGIILIAAFVALFAILSPLENV